MRVFHDVSTTDWTRVSVIVAAATAFWIGLAAIMPQKYHGIGMVILGAIQSAITLMMKSGQSPAQEAKEVVQAIQDKKQEIKDAELTISPKDTGDAKDL